jgi:hypothetical protein
MSILGKKCPTHTEAAQIIVFNLPFSKQKTRQNDHFLMFVKMHCHLKHHNAKFEYLTIPQPEANVFIISAKI